MSDQSHAPLALFRKWFDEALRKGLPDANAMALATVDASGQPACRIVLMKGIDEDGITFFTNYDSRKGRELTSHPLASVVFFWSPLERQVRMEGSVAAMDRAASEAYFATRARESQLGAWASRQSEEVADYETFLESVEDVEKRFAGGPVPCPPNWGGFKLTLSRLEYWQGKPGRLHDRFVYIRDPQGWTRHQLYP